jgi:hypothetical protein
MTVNTETFYPDTCQCVIALAWDDTANPVSYSGVSIVKDAPHNVLTDAAAIQCVLSENSMKGDAIGVVFSTFSGNTSVMSASGGTGFMRGFFGSGPIFRFVPGVSLQYLFQGLVPSRQIQITLAGAPLTATDNTTLQTNLNAMSGAPVILVSGGTLPASGIVVSPIPISGIVVTPTSAGT